MPKEEYPISVLAQILNGREPLSGDRFTKSDIDEDNNGKKVLSDAMQEYERICKNGLNKDARAGIELDTDDFKNFDSPNISLERRKEIRKKVLEEIEKRKSSLIQVITVGDGPAVPSAAAVAATATGATGLSVGSAGAAAAAAMTGVRNRFDSLAGNRMVRRGSVDSASDFGLDRDADAYSDAGTDPNVNSQAGEHDDAERMNSSRTMQVSYEKIREQASASRLVKLATDPELAFQGNSRSMTLDEYLDATKKLKDEIAVQYPGVDCNFKDRTLVAAIPRETEHGNGLQHDELIRSFDDDSRIPKVTITNPPDDVTIVIMLEMNRDILPLTMSKPCGDKETVVRLLEASVISGCQIKLNPSDTSMFQNLDQDNSIVKRYNYLSSLLENGNENQLEQFRNHVKGVDKPVGAWKFGETEIPSEYIEHLIKESPSDLTFESDVARPNVDDGGSLSNDSTRLRAK